MARIMALAISCGFTFPFALSFAPSTRSMARPALSPALQRVRKVPGVREAIPVVQGQVLAMGPNQVTGAVVRGVLFDPPAS